MALNPNLYTALARFPGGAEVSKAGMEGRFRRKSMGGASWYEPATPDGGEEYRICCPMCGDARNRCHINYMFGMRIKGLPVRAAAHCFNEGCEERGLSRVVAENLEYWRYQEGNVPAASEAGRPETLAEAVSKMAVMAYSPKGVTPLRMLPPTHPMAQYVRSRGLDPAYLSDSYGVGHVEGRPGGRFHRRMIVPVHCLGKYVGFLARAFPGWTPLTEKRPGKKWPYAEGKYVNSPGLRTSSLLYNYDSLPGRDVVVLVEGVSDVWKIGPWAAALCKDTVSARQLELLRCLGSPWIVLLGEPESAEKWKGNYMKTKGAVTNPDRVRLRLFAKGDPGDMSPRDNSRIVQEAINGPAITTVSG